VPRHNGASDRFRIKSRKARKRKGKRKQQVRDLRAQGRIAPVIRRRTGESE
jgi:hypothetical protein